MSDNIISGNYTKEPDEPKGEKDTNDKSIKAIITDPILSDDDKEKAILRTIRKRTISQTISFEAPYPPAEMLKQYNDATPDGANRILLMVENQSNHRIKLESHVIPEQLAQSKLGQYFGFILGILCLIATVTLALTGHDAVAGIVGGTTIVGLVAVFVTGKERQKSDIKRKVIPTKKNPD